ncbi:MAG: aldehyde dehydrogenase family protein [Bacteroidetes bacterium]|nr:aldehyde dehydrogenase family protein [Bacteroidota bacterium]
MLNILNFIDGEFVPAVGESWLDNVEPATGVIYSLLADSDDRDVALAVQAAEKAFPSWSNMPATERSRILLRIAEGIDTHMEELAHAESKDSGKPVELARTVDIPRARDNFHFFGTAVMHFASESHAMPGQAINYTLRQPLGTVACISPWNLPLYLFTWKIAPALAAGNCVVAKPSEITPATAWMLADIARAAGLPAGVLNIVHGLGPKVGAALVDHPGIKAISFTGGTKTGEAIARSAAPRFKKLSLELGGKNPNLIFADCDYEQALQTSVRSSLSNQGQICLCGSRIYVERALYDRFRSDFVARVAALIQGDPLQTQTQQGAVVSQAHFDKVMACIALAREEGGVVLTGGKPVKLKGRCSKGWFIEPTVIEGLAPGCRTNREEIFGPVVTLQPFDREDEALALANDGTYGLAATVWTQNLDRAHRLAEQLQAGVVWVNCWLLRDLRTPFGGMRDSGVGREGGWEAMRFFTEPKNVCIKY